MPSPLPEDVRRAVAAGRQLEAIRLLCDRTGLGLAEAKAAVESGQLPDAAPRQGFASALPADVAAALAAGDKLKAIRLLRRDKGLSLRQAKAVVDEAGRAAASPEARRAAGLSPGEVPRGRWSAGAVVLVVAVLGAVAWFLAGRA